MALSQSQRLAFEQQGYLHLPRLLDSVRDLNNLRNEYSELLERAAADMAARGTIMHTHSGLPFDQRIGCLFWESDGALNDYLDISLPQKRVTAETPMHRGPAVFALLRHPRLLDVVETFLGPEIYSNPTQHVRIKPPVRYLEANTRISSEVDTTVWHQDQGTVAPEADNTNMITVWIAVTESTEESGCLLIAPGSHKRGLALHCHDPNANYSRQAIPERLVGKDRIALQADPGDVVLLNKLTMHASLANRSRRIRWSLDLRYNPIGQPTGRPWFPGFVARSRASPESELKDAGAWAALWEESRANLAVSPPRSFQRWAKDDPGCA